MRRRAQLVALAGSLGLLLGALAFQYIGGMAPCALCIWQRWPHLVALLGAGALVLPGPYFALIGAAGAATSGAIGVYHTGVERAWWDGPSSCSAGGNLSGMSAQELLDQIMAAPVVRCDEVPWEMLGLSMASWNAVLSFGIAALWLASLRLR
ncbi:disulfide bond formation protein B [Roseinatronobacter sp. S2]|uniref:disulfide bond formation protein B n=1 Tax=Roseinatronobacter sp. S2 TaxID=3035471 RepID=UPI0027952A0A|nr:disulfide bond formation protein B [Roseinatronobacter sp. S2]